MYQAGSLVSFVKTKGKIGAKILEVAKIQDVNFDKYQELLENALVQILEPLGITFDDIKGVKKLDKFFAKKS
jgi:DNA polymerase I